MILCLSTERSRAVTLNSLPSVCPVSLWYGGYSVFEVDEGSKDSQVGDIIDFVIDSQMNFHLVDSEKSRLLKWTYRNSYSSLKVLLDKSGTSDSGSYGLKNPQGLFVDKEDNLFICDRGNHRILKRTPTGYVTTVGQDIYCEHIFVDDNTGDIYVNSLYDDAIFRFSAGSLDGARVAGDEHRGNSSSQLYQPAGIFVDRYGSLFICDYGNRRVQKWTKGATEGTTISPSGPRFFGPGPGPGPAQ
ncbi:unnamed protein product [Adineta steineri]|uniref:Uncharacterized protein n=1 Tax=Adineta steineri TaxID=433720 RepID=A0A815FC52_9BILA|nr:unnamed protein product [Adineta steineri]CAF1584623.1 unnamed protein product [Adineta steineri]